MDERDVAWLGQRGGGSITDGSPAMWGSCESASAMGGRAPRRTAGGRQRAGGRAGGRSGPASRSRWPYCGASRHSTWAVCTVPNSANGCRAARRGSRSGRSLPPRGGPCARDGQARSARARCASIVPDGRCSPGCRRARATRALAVGVCGATRLVDARLSACAATWARYALASTAAAARVSGSGPRSSPGARRRDPAQCPRQFERGPQRLREHRRPPSGMAAGDATARTSCAVQRARPRG
jgi:hypothetical protein